METVAQCRLYFWAPKDTCRWWLQPARIKGTYAEEAKFMEANLNLKSILKVEHYFTKRKWSSRSKLWFWSSHIWIWCWTVKKSWLSKQLITELRNCWEDSWKSLGLQEIPQMIHLKRSIWSSLEGLMHWTLKLPCWPSPWRGGSPLERIWCWEDGDRLNKGAEPIWT